LSGRSETEALAQLYAVSRLFINFFQPSFKLKSKIRDGARVHKTYHAPMTPCDRLLGLPAVDDETKAKLSAQFAALDPVRLLHEIRAAQQTLAELTTAGRPDRTQLPPVMDVTTFLSSLSRAWEDGEVRPTHRKQPGATHWWRSRVDPFEHTWPAVRQWLESESSITARDIMERLAVMVPDAYASGAQLRTLQRRIKQWRAEKAKDLILGELRRSLREREETTT